MIEVWFPCGTGNAGVWGGQCYLLLSVTQQGQMKNKVCGGGEDSTPPHSPSYPQTCLHLPLSLAVRNVYRLGASTEPSLSILSVKTAQQSLGTGLKDRRERVSECPLAVRELSHIVCISRVRLAGGLAPVRAGGLRACVLTGGPTGSSYFSLGDDDKQL